MNKKQKIVLWVAAALLVLVCVFPPTYRLNRRGRDQIDTVALIVQFVVPIVVIGTGLFLTLGNKTKKDE
jgi:ABC-type Fe3+ transport system permease subunit